MLSIQEPELGAAQAVLHGGFTLSTMEGPAGSAGSAHLHMTTAAPGPAAHGQMTLGSMLGMFAAHLLVAVVSGLWLAYGERAVFSAVRCAAQRVRASLALVDRVSAPLGLPRIKPRRAFRVRILRHRRLVHAIVSRGPPAEVAVV